MPLTLKDKPLENFQEFQDWLEDNNLFHDDNILYRGQANSVWPLESTLYRHRRNRLLASGIEEPDRSPHIDYLATEYLESATKLQAIIEALTGHRFGDITKDGTAFPFTTKATDRSPLAQILLLSHIFSATAASEGLGNPVARAS